MSKSKVTSATLVFDYDVTYGNPERLAAWKGRLTRYANRRSAETGTNANRFRAAVKASLTRRGHDTSAI